MGFTKGDAAVLVLGVVLLALIIALIVMAVQNEGFSSSIGTLTQLDNQTWQFIPVPSYSGPVTINYYLSDGISTIPATASFNITAVLQNPTVVSTMVPLSPGPAGPGATFNFSASQLLAAVGASGASPLAITGLTMTSAVKTDPSDTYPVPSPIGTLTVDGAAVTATATYPGATNFTFTPNFNYGNIMVTFNFDVIDANYERTVAPGLGRVVGSTPSSFSFIIPYIYEEPKAVPVTFSGPYYQGQTISFTASQLIGTSTADLRHTLRPINVTLGTLAPATMAPTAAPTFAPTFAPTLAPTFAPTLAPTTAPTLPPGPIYGALWGNGWSATHSYAPTAPSQALVNFASPELGGGMASDGSSSLTVPAAGTYLVMMDNPMVTTTYNSGSTANGASLYVSTSGGGLSAVPFTLSAGGTTVGTYSYANYSLLYAVVTAAAMNAMAIPSMAALIPLNKGDTLKVYGGMYYGPSYSASGAAGYIANSVSNAVNSTTAFCFKFGAYRLPVNDYISRAKAVAIDNSYPSVTLGPISAYKANPQGYELGSFWTANTQASASSTLTGYPPAPSPASAGSSVSEVYPGRFRANVTGVYMALATQIPVDKMKNDGSSTGGSIYMMVNGDSNATAPAAWGTSNPNVANAGAGYYADLASMAVIVALNAGDVMSLYSNTKTITTTGGSSWASGRIGNLSSFSLVKLSGTDVMVLQQSPGLVAAQASQPVKGWSTVTSGSSSVGYNGSDGITVSQAGAYLVVHNGIGNGVQVVLYNSSGASVIWFAQTIYGSGVQSGMSIVNISGPSTLKMIAPSNTISYSWANFAVYRLV